ncbi:cytochrome P450 [Parachaetomium inaequale]|uniref:Cytochrome P450 n=1 Tax=Parachaetomium inaequale TaxID=2588326 RepID=A0AAN6PCR1_9PEZI|nr:cytochrome P450 [Parachaetomium inaequale]
MTIASHLFSLPSLTIAGAVECFLAIRLFPDYFDSHSRFAAAVGTILLNYVFGVIFWALLYPNLLSPLRQIHGPREIISAAYRTIVVKEGPAGDLFLNLAKRYPDEDLIALDAFGRQIFVAKPRLLADLLSHKCYDFAKPRRIAAFLRLILGGGLVTVEEDSHKFLRKNTLPAFHARHITDLYPMMWTKAGILTRRLQSEIANGASTESKGSAVLELTAWANKVTLDIIGIAGMGREINAVEKASDPLQELYEELLEPSREKIVFAALNLAFGFHIIKMLPWQLNKLFVYLTSSLDNICRDLIREKRHAIVQTKDDHFDILSLLIKSNNFDDEVLKDQLLTFLAAGHETTASSLTWSAYLLAKHPEIQKKLRDEVTQTLGHNPQASDPPADLAGLLKQMPYLNGIMYETLRLYPTVPVTFREALRDTRIGEQFIPQGTEMVVSIWQINRSPNIWGADAGEFRPERWINADDGKPNRHGGAKSNYDFLTFLQGPRSCIGQEFAKAEMRCLLAALVTSFSWDLAMDEAKIVPRGVITIKPEHGMYLRMRPLHGGQ